jgi:hypothetical protein
MRQQKQINESPNKQKIQIKYTFILSRFILINNVTK